MSQKLQEPETIEQQLWTIGKPAQTIDGVEKVIGKAVFAYGHELPRILYRKNFPLQIHRSRNCKN